MGTREKFVARFGEDAATAIERAAYEHKNGVHDRTGSDPFRWAVTIVIGFQCVEVEGYRLHHGMPEHPTFDEFKEWVREEADLENHDGDVDYLGMMAGVYQSFMKRYDAAGAEVQDVPAIQMFPLSNDEYLKREGGCCPACGSEDVGGLGDHDYDGNWRTYLNECCECHARWRDVYTLSGYEDLEVQDEQVKG